MKIYLNRKPVEGPWGGGNKTIVALIKMIKESNHEYTFDINDTYDIIYCHDPRPDDRGISYQHLLQARQIKNAPIFQRVGDVFYHRGVNFTNYLKESVKYSDKVSFITHWAARFIDVDVDNKRTFVHELRPPREFFRKPNFDRNKEKEAVRIITHHWSSNSLKGVKYYNDIGKLLQEKKYKHVEFVYLGRAHNDINRQHITVIPPLDTDGVIDELDKSHIYVTASEFETGGNHVAEAIARGLPVLYHKNGGGINCLCRDSGHQFETMKEFESTLDSLLSDNNIIKKSKKIEKISLEDVCSSYIEEMEAMIK